MTAYITNSIHIDEKDDRNKFDVRYVYALNTDKDDITIAIDTFNSTTNIFLKPNTLRELHKEIDNFIKKLDIEEAEFYYELKADYDRETI